MYNSRAIQEERVKISPKKNLPRAKFFGDPSNPGCYWAHPVTIRAMRKDIFVTEASFEKLEDLYQCPSCHQQLDLQFWLFCPFCETPFPKDFLQKKIK